MSEEWVTVASFAPPPTVDPGFEAVLADEQARWQDAAIEAGFAPEDHVRLVRDNGEAAIQVSLALNSAFHPPQTLWRAD